MKTLLSCLSLGVTAVALTGGPDAVLVPLAAGLASGIAGNLATDLWKALDSRVAEQFFRNRPSIDENHHVCRALRIAQLNALRAVLERFEVASAEAPDSDQRPNARRFSRDLRSFLKSATRAAQSDSFVAQLPSTDQDGAIRDAILCALPDAFDQSLAARRTAGEPAALMESLGRLRRAVEAAVLEEVRINTFLDSTDQVPPLFLSAFAAPKDAQAWFELFVRDAAAALKEGGEFERIWNAEQVASIKSLADAHAGVLARIDAAASRTEAKVDGLADAVLAKLLATHGQGGLAAMMPSAALVARLHANIVPPVRCLGRSEEVDSLVGALTAPDATAVLVVVTGGPGLGKSTLTRAAGCHEAVVGAFGDRRCFVQLEHARTLKDLRLKIAEILTGTSDEVPLGVSLANAGDAKLLLILDNLETPWESCPHEVEAELAVLGAHPHVAVIASVRGQAVPSAPRWTLVVRTRPLAIEVSQELFLEFAPNISGDDPFLPDLLGQLGGVPLAIELVARQAASFSTLEPVWQEWQRSGTMMAKSRGEGESRLTSLDFSLALTLGVPYRREGVHRLLAAIAFLPGGMSKAAIAHVFADRSFLLVQDILESGIASEAEGRIDVLPPIRDHALRYYPMTEGMLDDLVSFYMTEASYSRKQRSFLWGIGCSQLVFEVENIQEVFSYAVHRRDPGVVCRAVGALYGGLGQTFESGFAEKSAVPALIILEYLGLILEYTRYTSEINCELKTAFLSRYRRLYLEHLVGKILRENIWHALQEYRNIADSCPPEIQEEIMTIVDNMWEVFRKRFGSYERKGDGYFEKSTKKYHDRVLKIVQNLSPGDEREVMQELSPQGTSRPRCDRAIRMMLKPYAHRFPD